jgi:hypothetical protein
MFLSTCHSIRDAYWIWLDLSSATRTVTRFVLALVRLMVSQSKFSGIQIVAFMPLWSAVVGMLSIAIWQPKTALPQEPHLMFVCK